MVSQGGWFVLSLRTSLLLQIKISVNYQLMSVQLKFLLAEVIQRIFLSCIAQYNLVHRK
jgi:hypothetical protein